MQTASQNNVYRFFEWMRDNQIQADPVFNKKLDKLKCRLFKDISILDGKVSVVLNTEEHPDQFQKFTELANSEMGKKLLEYIPKIIPNHFSATIEPVVYYIKEIYEHSRITIGDPLTFEFGETFLKVASLQKIGPLLTGAQIIDSYRYDLNLKSLNENDLNKLNYFKDDLWQTYFEIRFDIEIEVESSNSDWLMYVVDAFRFFLKFDAYLNLLAGGNTNTLDPDEVLGFELHQLISDYLKTQKIKQGIQTEIDRTMMQFDVFSPGSISSIYYDRSKDASLGVSVSLTSNQSTWIKLIEYARNNTRSLEKVLSTFYPEGTVYLLEANYHMAQHYFNLERIITKDSADIADCLSRQKITESVILKYREELQKQLKSKFVEKHFRFLFNTTPEHYDFDVNRLIVSFHIVLDFEVLRKKHPELKSMRLHKKADLFFRKLFEPMLSQKGG